MGSRTLEEGLSSTIIHFAVYRQLSLVLSPCQSYFSYSCTLIPIPSWIIIQGIYEGRIRYMTHHIQPINQQLITIRAYFRQHSGDLVNYSIFWTLVYPLLCHSGEIRRRILNLNDRMAQSNQWRFRNIGCQKILTALVTHQGNIHNVIYIPIFLASVHQQPRGNVGPETFSKSEFIF